MFAICLQNYQVAILFVLGNLTKLLINGGEGGIRTLGTRKGTTVFEFVEGHSC